MELLRPEFSLACVRVCVCVCVLRDSGWWGTGMKCSTGL